METNEIYGLIILILTGISVVYTINRGFKKERNELDNWKKKRETTDVNQDNIIKIKAKKIKKIMSYPSEYSLCFLFNSFYQFYCCKQTEVVGHDSRTDISIYSIGNSF